MDHARIINQLAGNERMFGMMVEGIGLEQARWKPGEDRWSILEVIHHLYDEEREDFRQRLQLVLKDPYLPWPPIDPERWAVERQYNEKLLDEIFQNFKKERQASVVWLESLVDPDWKATYQHPLAGAMSAERVLANWLAHDLLHLKQLVKLRWSYLGHTHPDLQLNYAGDWT